MPLLDPLRCLPSDPSVRKVAWEIYGSIAELPKYCPHGHCDPNWFVTNEPFRDPSALFVTPDHYVLRMLVSQGVSLSDLGRGRHGDDQGPTSEEIWQLFADHYYLFRGTPSRLWLDFAMEQVFGIDERLNSHNAQECYTEIARQLVQDDFRPRELFDRFSIAVLATTDHGLSDLVAHKAIAESSWDGRVIPTFRPDSIIDPTHRDFSSDLLRLGEITDCDIDSYGGYLEALQLRRQAFLSAGATATDHGPSSPNSARLSSQEATRLYLALRRSGGTKEEQELFRAHMLWKMAEMSVDDGLVMQLHSGSYRDHDGSAFQEYGPDIGADIPMSVDYVHALRPILESFGHHPNFALVVFTLDESTNSRELAPMAGYYSALRLGPPWWFFDAPDAMWRWRTEVTETAGFYNTVGFNDDTRGFLSIPGRHDLARRSDSAYLAKLVAEHRLDFDEAIELARELTVNLVKATYRL